MSEEATGILLLDRRIEPSELARLVDIFFGDMVKYVVDIERGVAAVGGQLHADAEQLLLAAEGPDGCIEYTALINIRPAQGNRSMLIADPAVRERVREITFALIGRGEPL